MIARITYALARDNAFPYSSIISEGLYSTYIYNVSAISLYCSYIYT